MSLVNFKISSIEVTPMELNTGDKLNIRVRFNKNIIKSGWVKVGKKYKCGQAFDYQPIQHPAWTVGERLVGTFRVGDNKIIAAGDLRVGTFYCIGEEDDNVNANILFPTNYLTPSEHLICNETKSKLTPSVFIVPSPLLTPGIVEYGNSTPIARSILTPSDELVTRDTKK